MMLQNHEDIENSNRKNKISSQLEAAADASDAAATLLDQEKKESISTDLIKVEEGEGGDIIIPRKPFKLRQLSTAHCLQPGPWLTRGQDSIAADC